MIHFPHLKIANKLLLIASLSILLVACDGESSSNTDTSSNSDNSRTITSNNSVTYGENGNQIVTNNDTVVEVDPDGVVLADRAVRVLGGPAAGDTVNTGDGGAIVTTPDGGISQFGGTTVSVDE